ncbi:MAG: NAD(P)-dependent oxidoreductase [Rhodospirillaceae bacterium]|jgi:3-hydroxyisobutyrate dehydrogenase|nr:NAD(P)-dependent oxidoreductase [Rhodospirillaceae bacterium]MBT7769916.1 NAD(P)-dependent oxidoreductase [Rhodospirillales bacterium]MBT4702040.1 NAD(P)-dependent oxidoreductase [Rhodospirillaceae bacterium]MBT5033957.1 NAD(P)-dependent oxidoreductase [Rhodospirillaceae bacterium]MBT6222090.1 NAD(P)-dependent oxidoreductase [Rhodospirillaceae bacterium]
MSKKVAFIGLGVMGYPMAGYLAKAGNDVTVYNRTTSKADKWAAEHGGNHADTPAKAADGADIVFMCVGNDNDVRSVTFGDTGTLAGMKDGAYLVDHTTASAQLAREIDEAARAKGLHFLDAPVSGGQAGAENGQLAVMVGGEEADFAVVEPVIDCYAKATTLMGAAGSGQLTKMVNQICIAGLVQGLSEGLNFAAKAGLDGEKVLGVISKGAAQSWQMENRGSTMLKDEYEFGFAVDWMRKDLGICFDESQRNKARLPATALVDQFYSHVQAKGGGRWDTSSLMKLLTED